MKFFKNLLTFIIFSTPALARFMGVLTKVEIFKIGSAASFASVSCMIGFLILIKMKIIEKINIKKRNNK